MQQERAQWYLATTSLLINFWPCWVFVAVHGLPLVVHGLLIVAASCFGVQAPGTRASVLGAHRSNCSEACGIFSYQGLNSRSTHS